MSLMVRASVGWHPGDEQHRPGYVALALLEDGTASFPMGHPEPFATPEQAQAILHRIVWDGTGPRYVPHLTLVT